MIRAFLRWQVPSNPKRREFARHCWDRLSRWDRPVVEFIRGMAQGSGLSLAEVTLLTLHEEIGRIKSCTAFGATGPGTRDGQPIIGQNWDWSSGLYPWSCLLRIQSDAMPSTLTYAYPGLWTATGMNEHGLSLVWTSSGMYPSTPPIVGIPTYVLIAGILTCRNCQEAIALLRRTVNAGCFIFFLADASGEVWVIEGFPGTFEAARCKAVISRGNHYECRRSRQSTHQRVPRATVKRNTGARAKRMAELVRQYRGRIDAAVAQKILCDHGVRPGMTICQHSMPERSGMTLDSFYLLPARREFWIARGFPCCHPYERHRV
jgi:hypothetical protein